MSDTSLTQCAFNKWRCLIALAHIDNKFQPTERAFLVNNLRDLGQSALSKEQLQILKNDFDDPKPPIALFAEILEEREKIDLLRLAYELFWVDGEFDAREKQAYTILQKKVSESLNVDRFMLEDYVKSGGKKVTVEDILKKIEDNAFWK